MFFNYADENRKTEFANINNNFFQYFIDRHFSRYFNSIVLFNLHSTAEHQPGFMIFPILQMSSLSLREFR